MHILFLSDNFPPEGNAPATRLYEHALQWVRTGHMVTVITCAPNFPEGKLFDGYKNSWRKVEVMDGIRVVRVKSYITANEGFFKRTLDFFSFMLSGFFFGCFERRFDVVVATSPQFFCAIAGMLLGLVRRKPFVLEIRDLWPESIVAVGAMRRNFVIRMLERIEMLLYRRAKRIVTVTNGLRDSIVSKGISKEKIVVVINGVDLTRYSPRDPDDNLLDKYGLRGKFVIGYVGTHGMAHALNKVVAAAEIMKGRDDIAFFFAGSGAERERTEKLVKSLGLSNVRMIPRQPKELMPALWSICSLALIPLRDSPLFVSAIPSKMFEALGMGIPILLSVPDGESTNLIKPTGAGICVKPEDPGALAKAIESLADTPHRMRSMRERSYASAKQFSREMQAKKMEEVLVNALM